MCTVSAIGDNWKDTFPFRYPSWPYIQPSTLPTPTFSSPVVIQQGVSQEEFDKLKKDVEELKELLKAAKKYDEATGQKDCEMDEKVEFIKKIAKFVGVDLNDVFRK